VKGCDWSIVEDSLVCRFHHLMGSKWSLISHFLPGRTDNGVKNRFHHLLRRYDKGGSAVRLAKGPGHEQEAILRLSLAAVSRQTTGFLPLVDESIDSSRNPHCSRRRSAKISGNVPFHQTENSCFYQLGPFQKIDVHVASSSKIVSVCCARCSLFIPSQQTGDGFCVRTKWCISCTKAPVFLSDDLLRTFISNQRGLG
jgi:Myb-like DNA-binding domain